MASTSDAQVVIELYKLRTEATMRKARHFVALEWWPTDFEKDIRPIMEGLGTEKNAYLRQVGSYWEMVASFALAGAVDSALLIESAGEMVFLYAKFLPFIPQMRESNPGIFKNTETLLTSRPEFVARVEWARARLAARAAAGK